MAAKKSTRGAVRKIGRRAVNHAALSERYTLSTLPDREVLRVLPGDTYFAVRGGAGSLGVLRKGRTVGWIDVGRLHHLSAKAWMQHVEQATSKRTKNPAKKGVIPDRRHQFIEAGVNGVLQHNTPSMPGLKRSAAILAMRRAWKRGGADEVRASGPYPGVEAHVLSRIVSDIRLVEREYDYPTINPSPRAPKRARAGRPLREGQRVYHCATRCR